MYLPISLFQSIHALDWIINMIKSIYMTDFMTQNPLANPLHTNFGLSAWLKYGGPTRSYVNTQRDT